MLRLQRLAQFLGVANELRSGFQRHVALRWKSGPVLLVDAARPRRHQDDPVAEKERLLEIVGNEDNRPFRHQPELAQLLLQALLRHDVERAEGLVHQQHIRIGGVTARQVDALFHSAGQLRGHALRKSARPTSATYGHDGSDLGGRTAAHSQAVADVVLDRHPREYGVLLEDDRPVGTGADDTAPPTRTSPEVGSTMPAITLSRVVLPQPDGPMMQTNSFSATVMLMRSDRDNVGRRMLETHRKIADHDLRVVRARVGRGLHCGRPSALRGGILSTITLPPSITNVTRCSSVISRNGFPAMAMRSASLPFSSVPIR